MEFLEIVIVFLFCVLSFLIGSKYYNQNQEGTKSELQAVSSSKSQYRQVKRNEKKKKRIKSSRHFVFKRFFIFFFIFFSFRTMMMRKFEINKKSVIIM